MKTGLSVLLLAAALQANSQVDAGSDAFRLPLHRAYIESQHKFMTVKGSLRHSMGSFYSVYTSGINLPGTDSSHIVVPFQGEPYLVAYFKPFASKGDAEKWESTLKHAFETVTGRTLYPNRRTETASPFTFYNADYFFTRGTSDALKSTFATSIYEEKGRYQLTLTVHTHLMYDNKLTPTFLTVPERDLAGKLKQLYQSATRCFSFARAVTIHGIRGKFSNGTGECYIQYQFDSETFGDRAGTEAFATRLRSALAAAMGTEMTIDEEKEQNSISRSYTFRETGKDIETSAKKGYVITTRRPDKMLIELTFFYRR